MLKSRLFEVATSKLWEEGLISGEMHLGTGEEAIVAGIVDHLKSDDAMALDHRATPPMIMRGIDPVSLLREFLGKTDGLCRGMGGHMHLFSKQHLAASSGIVGAAGPTASGFALAARYLRPESIAVAFFGDGAINQGMLMESMNLAVAWNLPVLFVCKDDSWAITTESAHVTGGGLEARALGLGLSYIQTDGKEISAVWHAAGDAVSRLRSGEGPIFFHATCVHLEGHFLGYQLIRAARKPLKEMPGLTGPLVRSLSRRGGATVKERIAGLKYVTGAILTTLRDPREKKDNDPVFRARRLLLNDQSRLHALEDEVENKIGSIVVSAIDEDA